MYRMIGIERKSNMNRLFMKIFKPTYLKKNYYLWSKPVTSEDIYEYMEDIIKESFCHRCWLFVLSLLNVLLIIAMIVAYVIR